MCTSFDKNYTELKIVRRYLYDQLTEITVYLYTPEPTAFPTNFREAPMTSEYITLTLYTDWGGGSMCNWGGSKDEAFLTDVSLEQASKAWDECYKVAAKSKMLTLEEAEQLLEKGYVFGGQFCTLCMAAQPEVDFSDYTYVDIEYVSGKIGDSNMRIPFYAFYKYIGKNEYGMDTYAKTYVAAVQINGYEEYFENQKNKHK